MAIYTAMLITTTRSVELDLEAAVVETAVDTRMVMVDVVVVEITGMTTTTPLMGLTKDLFGIAECLRCANKSYSGLV